MVGASTFSISVPYTTRLFRCRTNPACLAHLPGSTPHLLACQSHTHQPQVVRDRQVDCALAELHFKSRATQEALAAVQQHEAMAVLYSRLDQLEDSMTSVQQAAVHAAEMQAAQQSLKATDATYIRCAWEGGCSCKILHCRGLAPCHSCTAVLTLRCASCSREGALHGPSDTPSCYHVTCSQLPCTLWLWFRRHEVSTMRKHAQQLQTSVATHSPLHAVLLKPSPWQAQGVHDEEARPGAAGLCAEEPRRHPRPHRPGEQLVPAGWRMHACLMLTPSSGASTAVTSRASTCHRGAPAARHMLAEWTTQVLLPAAQRGGEGGAAGPHGGRRQGARPHQAARGLLGGSAVL